MSWYTAVPGVEVIGDVPTVDDITHDSRRVHHGTAFIAVPGQRTDGHDYLESVVGHGAAAIVVQADRPAKWLHLTERVPIVVVRDCRAAMGPLASAVHDHPTAKLRVVGVTGTDGKTTSSFLISHALARCGFKAGFLTSAGFDTGSGLEPNESHMTTIEATLLQSHLARAVADGRDSMVVEASSEGLAMHRLDGCEVDVAVFTNLTRDHLDFHGTMAHYLEAKGLLFEKLAERTAKSFPRAAIVNADDDASRYLRALVKTRVIRYGFDAGADVRAVDIDTSDGLRFAVEVAGQRVDAYAPLAGRFNVYNCLAAVGVLLSQGASLHDAVAALSDFTGVPGRLERVESGQPFRVYIDIASTPVALENTLDALRAVTPGKLWVVFGAAGGRDPARRDGMGRVAGRLADRAVLTNEDPRDEDPDAIIETIASGLRESGRVEGEDFVRLPDRREALSYALRSAGPGDTVLLAGKANEPSMVFAGGHEVPWNERRVAEEILAGL